MSKSRTIRSLADYLKYIPSSHAMECKVVFRGQSKDRSLVPSLFREGHASIGRDANWESYEQQILRIFKRESIPALKTEPQNLTDWIALAQHHGVPTRTLDWSVSPLSALYFAVESNDKKNDGVVWSYFATHYRVEPFETFDDLYGITDTWLYIPRHEDQRMTAQNGCLTFHPLPKLNEPFVPYENSFASSFDTTKFIIPAELKETLLFQLDDLGINAHSIYPDLDGLAKEIKQKIYRVQSQGADAIGNCFTQKII
jgi:hypothetical protein